MAVRTLKPRSAMLSLLPHPTFTISRLRTTPHGAPYVARFEELREEGRQVLLHELAYIEAITEAQARVVAIDIQLDGFASRLSKEILTITSDDRTNALYLHYFERPLGEVTRPVLNGQLETMKKWLISLPKSPYPALSAMAQELEALIAQADDAVTAREGARAQNREFRDVGERRQWVDRLNGARKEVHGALAKLPHEDPGLPSDFADQFFLSEPEREEAEPGSVEALRAEAEALRETLARVEARVAEAEAAEAQRKAAAEARTAQEAELAELERAAAALEQKRAALKAQLAAMAG